MNCKLGDLAIIVRSKATENIGAIVEVIGVGGIDIYHGQFWEVISKGRLLKIKDRDLHCYIWEPVAYCYDIALRPIRPNDSLNEPYSYEAPSIPSPECEVLTKG